METNRKTHPLAQHHVLLQYNFHPGSIKFRFCIYGQKGALQDQLLVTTVYTSYQKTLFFHVLFQCFKPLTRLSLKARSSFKTKDEKHSTDQTLIYVTRLCLGNRHGTGPIVRSAVSSLLHANPGNYLSYLYPAVYTAFPPKTVKKQSGMQMAFRSSNVFL